MQNDRQRATWRRYYHRNKAKIRQLADERRERNGNIVYQIKNGNSCASGCGQSFYPCLDFHHVENKDFDIARHGQDYSVRRLIEEIEKCAILCANCHRVLHYTLEFSVWFCD